LAGQSDAFAAPGGNRSMRVCYPLFVRGLT
jgi:hypothetical protein